MDKWCNRAGRGMRTELPFRFLFTVGTNGNLRKRAKLTIIFSSFSVTDLYVKRHEYFRWTPRTAYLSLLYVVAIPGSLYWLSTRTEVRFSFVLSGFHPPSLIALEDIAFLARRREIRFFLTRFFRFVGEICLPGQEERRHALRVLSPPTKLTAGSSSIDLKPLRAVSTRGEGN